MTLPAVMIIIRRIPYHYQKVYGQQLADNTPELQVYPKVLINLLRSSWGVVSSNVQYECIQILPVSSALKVSGMSTREHTIDPVELYR